VQRRKLLLSLCVPSLVIIGVCSGKAQNVITLGATSSNRITFAVSEFGHETLSLRFDPLPGITLRGVGESGPDPYSIVEAEGPTVSATLTGANTGSIRQSVPLTFSDGAGGSMLEGNLELLSPTETGRNGQLYPSLVLDLAQPSGSGANIFSPPGAVAQLESFGAGQQSGTTLSGGEDYSVKLDFVGNHPWHPDDPWHPNPLPLSVDPPASAPEPASMLLIGSGLVVLGSLVRRGQRKGQRS